MKKLTLLAGAAAGYVLGARAGRERYEQIKEAAGKVRRNPRVQSAVDDVQAQASAAAHQAAAKVSENAQQAASRVTEKVRENLGSDPADPHTDLPRPDLPPPGSTS